jgi:hypothetical protein
VAKIHRIWLSRPVKNHLGAMDFSELTKTCWMT